MSPSLSQLRQSQQPQLQPQSQQPAAPLRRSLFGLTRSLASRSRGSSPASVAHSTTDQAQLCQEVQASGTDEGDSWTQLEPKAGQDTAVKSDEERLQQASGIASGQEEASNS